MGISAPIMLSRRILAWLLGLLILAGSARADVRYDMPKAELLKELGKPTSTLKQPGTGREILNYPKGVRIEIEKGVVVSVKGLDLAAVETATKAAAAEKAEAEAAAKLKQEAQEKIQAVQAEAAAKAEKLDAAKARLTMETTVAAREKRETLAGHKEQKQFERAVTVFALKSFLIGLVIQWLLMVAALKLTTKYWSVDVQWPGLLLAAAADTGTRTVIALIGQYVFHASSLFYIDQASATVVLVLVLRKVSTNQSLNQAVGIAMGVKVFSIVVGSILITMLLNMGH